MINQQSLKFRPNVDGRSARLPDGGSVIDFYDHRANFAWYTPEMRFARYDREGNVLARGATLRDVLPNVADQNSVHTLVKAGKALAKARAAEREARDATFAAITAAVADGVSESAAARLAGVDRMTVRKVLGKL